MSPVLYAIYTKGITKKVNPQTKIVQYAYDVAVIVREDNYTILKSRLKSALLQIDDNLKEIGFLEHGKTSMIDSIMVKVRQKTLV